MAIKKLYWHTEQKTNEMSTFQALKKELSTDINKTFFFGIISTVILLTR